MHKAEVFYSSIYYNVYYICGMNMCDAHIELIVGVEVRIRIGRIKMILFT